MNYKTTLVAAAIAVAAITALGSAFPMVGTAFASIFPIPISPGDENTANSCSGELGNNNDCRQQGFQLGGEDNEQNNDFRESAEDD
jgi:hypothetical protein